MRKINGLFNEFETLCLVERNVAGVSERIYAELIEIGYIPSDLKDTHTVTNMCLVDLEQEFTDRDVLGFLVYRIMTEARHDIAEAEEEEDDYDFDEDDCDYDCEGCTDCDEEDEIEEEELELPLYIVSVIKMDFVEGEKETEVMPTLFTSLKEVYEHVEMKGMSRAVGYLMGVGGEKVGHTAMLSAKEAVGVLTEMGENGKIMADLIPDSASNIVSLVIVSEDRAEILSADMYVLYDVTITE